MSNRRYPISIAELNTWREEHGVTAVEAQERFLQYVVLECIAAGVGRREIILKGGNALRFVYRSLRSTIDLDFTATRAIDDNESAIRTILDQSMSRSLRRHGVKTRVQRLERRPKRRPNSNCPTYLATIAYQMPGDRHFAAFESYEKSLPQVVKLEISLNDVVCEVTRVALDTSGASSLQVCTLEDILAEKLRAILQQAPRNRHRPQDVFDIARFTRTDGTRIDKAKVSEFLIRKAVARGIHPRKTSFNNDLKARSAVGYDELEQTTGEEFIPFESAWAEVIQFVASLDIPG